MSVEYRIGMLWMEGPLSFLEQLCIVSFRDAGHEVVLYHYGDVQNVPEGITMADAATVLPNDSELVHAKTGSPALLSDLFRYRLLAKEDRMIWADTDVYCFAPLRPVKGHLHSWENEKRVNGAILALPRTGQTLKALLAFTAEKHPVPGWFKPRYREQLLAARDRGDPVHVKDLDWGVWGPHALTHYLKETGDIQHSLPAHVLYPVSFADRRKLCRPGALAEDTFGLETKTVHFYGQWMRNWILETQNGAPRPRSLVGRLMRKHGLSAPDAPIKRLNAASEELTRPPRYRPLRPRVRRGRGAVNLTDLADKYGTDKGSRVHRYTELYHLLLQPHRERDNFRFLEMGLQIGGPEHGKSADRKTTDVPSVRMWLEYFPKAQIIGLDVSDFSSFEMDRFSFIRCDMDHRENIAVAMADEAPFDVILDDASHASHHQQNAFLELFPKLKSGGVYIIEDMFWQPKSYERRNVTKTADLMQSYVNTGVFTHSDRKVEALFNALRADISGLFVHQVHFKKTEEDQVAVIHKR